MRASSHVDNDFTECTKLQARLQLEHEAPSHKSGCLSFPWTSNTKIVGNGLDCNLANVRYGAAEQDDTII